MAGDAGAAVCYALLGCKDDTIEQRWRKLVSSRAVRGQERRVDRCR